MRDEIDWSITTWEGNRLRQHREFRALSFRDKLIRIEQRDEVSQMLLERAKARRARAAPGESAAPPEG